MVTDMNDDLRDGERLEPRPETQKKESSGEYLWRVLKPAGCILVLVILVLYFIVCFTFKGKPPAETTGAPQTEQTSK